MADWLIAAAILVGLFLPLVPLFVVGFRRSWPFPKYGPYIIAYGFLVALGLLAGLGARGWMLALGVLLSAAGGTVAFLLWARVIEIGEEAARSRRVKR